MVFPRHRAAASLKHPAAAVEAVLSAVGFSAASGRGLIEARGGPWFALEAPAGFSAASGRGLIEAGAQCLAGRRRAEEFFRGIGPRPH